MVFDRILFAVGTVLVCLAIESLSSVQAQNARVLNATAIQNGSGLLNIPSTTPTASRVAVFDGSQIITSSSVTTTTLGFLDATSSIQTQLNGKQASGNYITGLTGDVVATGPGSVASTIQASAVTNAKLANMAANTVKANVTGGSAAPTDIAITSANTASAAVIRDGSGNFSAGTITASLTGNATNVTGTVAVANGGTGQTTVAAASRALIPATSAISASSIDWSLSNVFSKTLSGNTTFTFANAQDGQTITVCLTNTASNFTVTWPAMKWTGGAAPTETVGAKTDCITIIDVGGTFFANSVQNMS